MIKFNVEICKVTKALIHEYKNDIHAAYAAVHNNTIGPPPAAKLIEVKQYLEHLMACEAMEEYGWEQDEMGLWHYVSSEEFFSRWREAREQKE